MWSSANLANFNSSLSQQLLNDYNDKVCVDVIEDHSHKSKLVLAPSSIRCMRKSWFRLRGRSIPTPPCTVDSTLKFFAQMGDACHNIVQNRLKNIYKDRWLDVGEYVRKLYPNRKIQCTPNGNETQIYFPDVPIQFSVDGLINLGGFSDDKSIELKGKPVIIEIKSVDYSVFQGLFDVKDEHRDQAICYATLLDVESILFLYVDRQYGEVKCYELKVNSVMKTEMRNRIYQILEAVKDNLPPPRLPKGDSWCSSNRCEYFKACQEYN